MPILQKTFELQTLTVPIFISSTSKYLIVYINDQLLVLDHNLDVICKIPMDNQNLSKPMFACFTSDKILINSYQPACFLLVDIKKKEYQQVHTSSWIFDEGLLPFYWWEKENQILLCNTKGDLIDCNLSNNQCKSIKPSEIAGLYPNFHLMYSHINRFRFIVQSYPEKQEICFKDLVNTQMTVKNFVTHTQYACPFPTRRFLFSFYKYTFAFVEEKGVHVTNVKNGEKVFIEPPQGSSFCEQPYFFDGVTVALVSHDNSSPSHIQTYKINVYKLIDIH